MSKCTISDSLNFAIIFKEFSTFDPNSDTIESVARRIGKELQKPIDMTDPAAIEFVAQKLSEYCKIRLQSRLYKGTALQRDNLQTIINNANSVAEIIVNPESESKLNETNTNMQIANSPDPQENSDYLVRQFVYRELHDLYHSAQAAQLEMEKTFKFGLIGSFLIDYENGEIIQGIDQLNQRIAGFKQSLADIITEYYCKKSGISDINSQRILLFKDGKYVANSKTSLKSKAQELFKTFNEDMLNDLFQRRTQSDDASLALRAYNAWVMLNNFDTLAKHFLKDTIQIDQNNVNREVDITDNKYRIVDKTGLVKTWRTSDDINALDELGSITNLIIESIPMYEYNQYSENDSLKLSEQNMTLADFTFAFQQVFMNDKLRNQVQESKANMGEFIPKLIDTALQSGFSFGANDRLVKNVLYSVKRRIYTLDPLSKGYSLAQIIRNLQNQTDFAVGKVPSYLNYVSSVIDKSIQNIFLNYEWDYESKTIKVKESRDTTASNREYSIRQAIENQNQALRRTPEETRRLANVYKIYNPSSNPTGDASGKLILELPHINGAKFRVYFTNKIGTRGRGDTSSYLSKIEYVNSNGASEVIYGILSGSENVSGNPYGVFSTDKYNLALENTLTQFVDDTLNQGFKNTPYLLEAFAKFLPPKNESAQSNRKRELTKLEALIELIPMASRVIIKHTIESNPEYANLDENGKFISIKPDTNLNAFYQGIDETDRSTSPKTTDGISLKAYQGTRNDSQCLKAITQARMLINGELSKGTVKNIEGNSVATTGLTNLMATTFIGWNDSKKRLNEEEQIKKRIDLGGGSQDDFREVVVASNLFLKHPELFLRYSIKAGGKGQDPSNIKSYKKFTASESMQTAMLYDFLMNYGTDETGNEVIGNGVLRFQPTVYSDKTRNYIIEINGNSGDANLRFINMDANGFRSLHYASQRELYSRLKRNLAKDYKKVLLNFVSQTDQTGNRIFDINDLELNILQGENYEAIYNLVTRNGGLFDRINKLFSIKSPLVSGYKNAKELYKSLSTQNNVEQINNIHFDDGSKKELKENQVLKHYFRMFTDANDDYYWHIVNRNKLRFAQEVASSLNLFYQKGDTPNSVIDNAFNRIASILSKRNGTDFNTEKAKLIEDWVNPVTGKLLIARLNGIAVSKQQLLDTKIDFITGPGGIRTNNITLNPIIDAFFAADTYFSQEFINSTVGGAYVHKNNFKSLNSTDEIDRLEEEDAGRYLSQFKRMVIFPATMHPLHQEVLEGTATYYNVACIDDIPAHVWDYKKGLDGDDIDAHDGAGFCDPVVSEYENGSLEGAHAGDVKKPIGHYFNDIYGTSSLLKYALFPVSNEQVRNSSRVELITERDDNGVIINQRPASNGDPREGIQLKRTRYKMSSVSWYSVIDIPGLEIDITKKFNGRSISMSELASQYYWDPNLNTYIRIESIKKTGEDIYTITRVPVREDGSEIIPRTPYGELDMNILQELQEVRRIDNNFALWMALGAEWSCSLIDGKMVEDESSIKNLAFFGNNVGFVRHQGNQVGMEFIREDSTKLGILGKNIHQDENGYYTFDMPLTQKDVFQPLKYAGIHYLVGKSAVKSGQTNMNSTMSWYDNTPLRSKRMSTSNFGIQMDADHHADDSELSEMTQVISALEANGWGHELAKFVYTDLGNIVAQSMAANTKALQNYFQTGNTKEIYRILGKALLSAYSEEESGKANLTDAIVRNLQKEIENSTDIVTASTSLPMSNNDIMNDIIKTVTSKINKSAIKRKYAGMGAVMVPAYNLIKVYKMKNAEGKFIDTLQGRAFKQKVDHLSDTFTESPVVESADLDLGGSYVLVENTSIGEGMPLFEYTINGTTYYIGSTYEEGSVKIRVYDSNGTFNQQASENILTDDIRKRYLRSINQLRRYQIISQHKDVKIPITFQFSQDLAARSTVYAQALQRMSAFTNSDNIEKYAPSYVDVLNELASKKPDERDSLHNSLVQALCQDLGLSELETEIMSIPSEGLQLPLARIELDSLEKYDRMRSSNFLFRQDYTVGRNLQPARTTFTVNGRKFNIFDVKQVRDRMEFNKFLQDYKKSPSKYSIQSVIDNIKDITREHGYSERAISLKNKILALVDQSNISTYLGDTRESRGYIKRYLQAIDTELEKGVIDAFKAVHAGGTIQIKDKNSNIVTLQVDKGSAEVRDAELIMSKAYATKFGIKVGDNVSDIDFKYFRNQLIDNFRAIQSSLYDIVLRRSNGRHTYIVSSANESNLTNAGYELIEPSTFTDPDTGETVRLDEDTKEEMSSWNNCKLYRDAAGNEFVVTDDIKQFIDDDSYTSWSLNPYIQTDEDEKHYAEYVESIKQIIANIQDWKGQNPITPEQFIEICNSFNQNNLGIDSQEVNNFKAQLSVVVSGEDFLLLKRFIDKSLKDVLKRKLTDNPAIVSLMAQLNETKLPEVDYYNFKSHLNQAANKKFVSFQESLNLIAARIPSQSLQSFMSMKVVGFTESEENRAYVSHFQAYLQGSDYDIDKVYLMGSEFTEDGTYISWSPLFDFYSIKTLEKSQEFPMPNGQIYRIITRSEDNNVMPEDSVDISSLLKETFDARELMIQTKQNPELSKEQKENSIINYLDKLKKLITFVQSSKTNNLFVDSNIGNADFKKFARGIERLINSHTQYLTKIKSKDKLLKITKNSVTARIYQISRLPENTYAAYSPIEMETSQEAAVYSTMGESERSYNTMNPATKFHMMEQNMMGKDGIGIAAVGVKVLFALQFYYNEALRGNPSEVDSPEFKRQRNAYFEKRFNGLSNIDGTINVDVAKNIIANVNWEGEVGLSLFRQRILDNIEQINQSIRNLENSPFSDSQKASERARLEFQKEIVELQLNYMTDSSLVNSSLLSAATDNAKELILAKINANPDLMKVYIYGIVMGIDFNDIAHLMTSNTVNTITALSEKNIFDEYEGFNNLNNTLRIIQNGLDIDKYLPKGWKSIIDSPNPTATSGNNIIQLLQVFTIPEFAKKDNDYQCLPRELQTLFDTEQGNFNDIASKYLGIIDTIKQQLSSIKSTDDLFQHKRFMYQILDIYEEFLNRIKDMDIKQLKLFIEMYESAEELSELGRNLGINQGIKTSMAEKMTYLDSVENAFENRLRKIRTEVNKIKQQGNTSYNFLMWCIDHNKERYAKFYPEPEAVISEVVQKADKLGILTDFNIFNFMYDPDYQEAAVDMYDLVKKTLNRLDVIRTVPHFKAMIQTAVDDFMLFDKCISKVDILYNFAHKFNKEDSSSLNSRDKERFYRDMQSYIDAKIITKFFKDNKNSDVVTSVRITDGNFVDKNWKLQKVQGEHIIDLSTMEGQATFKLWMETQVIPNLKKGFLNDAKTDIRYTIGQNDFIQGLIINSTNRTLTGHLKYLYTLPINMMDTQSDYGKNMLVKYTSAFDKLNYDYNGIPIKLLFFYYNLLVNRGAMGQLSLTPIFKNAVLQNEGNNEINKFFKWEGQMDSMGTLSQEDIDYYDMLLSCAVEKSQTWLTSKKSKSGKYPTFVKVKDYKTGLYKIYKFNPDLLSNDSQNYSEDDYSDDTIYEALGGDIEQDNFNAPPVGYSEFQIGPYNSMALEDIIDLMPYLTTDMQYVEAVSFQEKLLRLINQGKILAYNNCE